MTAKELVGPLKDEVRFQDGTVLPYVPPRDTVDGDRWRGCTEHRVACDCREAEFAEQIGELRSELRAAREAAREILAGHATFAYEDSPSGRDREIGCACTGCQIARKAYLLSHHEAGRFARDEVDGLSDWDREFGNRWKVCHDGTRTAHPGVCEWAVTRQVTGRPYHEHLTHHDGAPVRVETDEVPF